MRNTSVENIQEHSHQVAVIAHMLAVIHNVKFCGNCKKEAGTDTCFEGKIDPGNVALKALYHDCSEIFTGDLPTPVKYANSKISTEYKRIEKASLENLLETLPKDLQTEMRPYVVAAEADDECLTPKEKYEARVVKAADKISAYIKCLDESKAGNDEYAAAMESTRKAIEDYGMPEADYFVENMLTAVSYSLDELMSD